MSSVETKLQDELAFPASCPCANTGCTKPGVKTCADCYLVLYCSRECQKSDWKQHKVHCKSPLAKETWRPSWDIEGRVPAFVTEMTNPADMMEPFGKQKYLWGNVPALDVLNLPDNEGPAHNQDIHLLFAAFGDPRHVIKTLATLPPRPPTAPPQSITAILNDRDFDIVARNAILLLTALHVDSAPAAAAVMLHTWYSALLPSAALDCLHLTVQPLISAVCEKTARKDAGTLLGKTWTRRGCSLRLVLEKRYWDALLAYLEVPKGLTVEGARRVRAATVMVGERRDYWERVLLCQPVGWRAASVRFWGDGLLVPFGAGREAFDRPNPTFFREKDVWPMMDTADPLEGWVLDDVLRKTPVAKNDLYGGLFFYIRDLLVELCSKLQVLDVSFVLLHGNAVGLPGRLANEFNMTRSFDRIEISNIAHRGYLGLGCLNTFTPLLRPLDENPHATLLPLFLNAIAESATEDDSIQTLMRETGRIDTYVPRPSPSYVPKTNGTDANSIRRVAALDLLQDFDGLFARYVRESSFDAVAKHAGARQKPKHTIVAPWPLRLSERATKEEFDKLQGSGHAGNERYVEWQRDL